MTDIDHAHKEWKPSYRIAFRGKRAVETMRLLYPLMGKRRKAQIEKAIGEKPDTFFSSINDWFFWLAGLLEGEGSFQKPIPSKQNLPCVQLYMTDQDVVEYAALHMQVNSHGPYYRGGSDSRFKPRYLAALHGKRAVDLMRQLQPHMSLRRQAQIERAIATYQPIGQIRGEQHPQAKLDAAKVREIKKRLHNNEMASKLAKEYGVDRGLIWQIKVGRIWQHVE
jgi:hypothetical protein